MDKAALLTASRVEPIVSAHPRSDLIRLLGPPLQAALQFQSLLSSISLFLCLRAWFLTSVALTAVLYTSRIVAVQAFLATKLGTFYGCTMSSQAVASIWNTKTIQKLRKKLFYEFAVFILGSGNVVFVMLFWPGWWLIAGLSGAAWLLFG